MKLPMKANHTTFWGHCTCPLWWPTICLWSVFLLNKSTSHLSLCLSLNSFCNETSRTWASLGPKTRCVFSIKRPWIQVPIWVAWFQYQWWQYYPWFHPKFIYLCPYSIRVDSAAQCTLSDCNPLWVAWLQNGTRKMFCICLTSKGLDWKVYFD